jgi:hypothetical protein
MTDFNLIKRQTKLWILCASLMLSLTGLSGCIQGKTFASTQYDVTDRIEVSDALLRSVNASFHHTFVGGDWYYQGAEEVKGEIYAYIQIPQKMQLNTEQQKHYLEMAICPNKEQTQLWNKLENIPLSVHVYTFNKRYTVHARCSNPFA